MSKSSQRSAARRIQQNRAMANGLQKRVLDKMHELSLERFGVGIGVVVQEEQRAKAKVKSLTAERDGLSFFAWDQRRKLNGVLKAAEDEYEVWNTRLRLLTLAVVPDAQTDDLMAMFQAEV